MTVATQDVFGPLIDGQGRDYAATTLTPADDQREKTVLAKPSIIPVLFIPGIMGTNLRKKGSKERAWRPPNMDLRGAGDLIAQLFSYLAKNTAERARDLQTNEAEVDFSGPIDAGDSGLPKNVLMARGWGALLRSSYHPFMGRLQQELNRLAEFDFKQCKVKLQGWAASDGSQAATEWGAESGAALTEGEILHAANYQFDVWAAGYNWLQSNRDSAQAIKDLIEKTILPYYNEGKPAEVKAPNEQGESTCSIEQPKPTRPRAEQVIVVTHSMGGLVSRALTEVLQCDKVMGVSHGVQPATGAPATYKRMRAGFEGAEQLFLGRNAADVVAILSQSPGGLELLPTADYNGGQPWLKLRDQETGKVLLELPKPGGDPYKEIYLSSAWYGMVPEENTRLLGGSATPNSEIDPRDQLGTVVNSVKSFHESIKAKYKVPTFVHYGAQGKRDKKLQRGGLLGSGVNIPLIASSPRNLFTWGEVVWEGNGLPINALSQAVARVEDDGNGMLRLANGSQLRIAAPDCPGDGTVPVHSGEAPRRAGVAMSFAHGHGNLGRHNAQFCYDHQGSYGDQRALYATMYAVIKIAQKAKWHKA